ncbi:MAG: TraR/DksA family transcriptional regulator [Rhodothermales bacterium]
MTATLATGRTHLSDEQLRHFKKMLLKLRSEVADELEREHDQIEVEREQHYDEVPVVDTETVSRLSARELSLINRIDEALERIDKGTFGMCLKTGKPIPLERLELVPYAEAIQEAEDPVD